MSDVRPLGLYGGVAIPESISSLNEIPRICILLLDVTIILTNSKAQ
jgi:hypothetical protein